MIYEDFVVNSVAKHLRERNYETLEQANVNKSGIDLVMKQRVTKQAIFVEAKGQGSSKPSSSRFGKEFTESQVFDCVAKAAFKAMETQNRDDFKETDISCVAFPLTEKFRRWQGKIRQQLATMHIVTFWVEADGSVQHVDGFYDFHCFNSNFEQLTDWFGDEHILDFPTNDSEERAEEGFVVGVDKNYFDENKIPSLSGRILMQFTAANPVLGVNTDTEVMSSAYKASKRLAIINRLFNH